MKFPQFKARKSALIGAFGFYTFFIIIYGWLFLSMSARENSNGVQVESIILASLGVLTMWFMSLHLLRTVMTMWRPDITAVIWFTTAFLTFLICQIFLFGVMYKATGIETKGTIDNMAYLYFSVMTLTTVGYGDITPKDAGRFVAIIQVLSGYIYMGIFIGVITSSIMSVNQVNISEDRKNT